jgi:micrococcal nuclease
MTTEVQQRLEQALYLYRGLCVNVVDGDTVDILIDLGFNTYSKQRLRLLGINTAERNSKDSAQRALANAATDYLKELILDKQVFIRSRTKDKYGRYLADIFIADTFVNTAMITKGYAVVY